MEKRFSQKTFLAAAAAAAAAAPRTKEEKSICLKRKVFQEPSIMTRYYRNYVEVRRHTSPYVEICRRHTSYVDVLLRTVPDPISENLEPREILGFLIFDP